MISIITGDIINSRNKSIEHWLPRLKSVLNTVGNAPKTWEIFRGDSFQIEATAQEALLICLKIKATIKMIDKLDVRLAIGIGTKNFDAQNITEANGEAHIHSGFAFDNLLKKQNLAIKTNSNDVNEELNVSLALALLVMNYWTVNSAEYVKVSLENSSFTQKQISKLLGVSQASISKRGKRAGLDEILKLEKRYRTIINQKL